MANAWRNECSETLMEGAGEDPYLGSKIAAARVRGFQGSDLAATDTLAACAKHYAGYGLAEAGRDYNTVDISEQTLHNVVLPPFKAAVDAGVATLMNAFNEIGGIPATGSTYLQRNILKGDWGFDGCVVSDWGSIGEMRQHGYAADLAEAGALAVTAGDLAFYGPSGEWKAEPGTFHLFIGTNSMDVASAEFVLQ